jgi:hypothetical protein
MSNPTEHLVLHTTDTQPAPDRYAAGSYRTVVGLEVAENKLWLPGDHGEATQEVYEVPQNLAQRAIEYAERHYADEAAEQLYRNCHIGAAAITGAGHLGWVDAVDLANRVVFRGNQTPDLTIGQWGAIGDKAIGAYHSMVGIAPGIALQTDSVGGPLSVIKHEANLNYYKSEYGSEQEMFALDENPKHDS